MAEDAKRRWARGRRPGDRRSLRAILLPGGQTPPTVPWQDGYADLPCPHCDATLDSAGFCPSCPAAQPTTPKRPADPTQ